MQPCLITAFNKSSGQATVTVNVDGKRKDILLGLHMSPQSKQEYRPVLADLSAGRLSANASANITVNELYSRYWKFAEERFRHPVGNR